MGSNNPFNTADLTDINLNGNGAEDADTRDFNGKHSQDAGVPGQTGIQPMQIESTTDDNGDGASMLSHAA